MSVKFFKLAVPVFGAILLDFLLLGCLTFESTQNVESTQSVESAQSYYERGIQLEKVGYNYAAMEAYSSAIKLDPNFADAYVKRATLYFIGVDYSSGAALKDCNKAIEIDQNIAQAYFIRGKLLAELGNGQVGTETYALEKRIRTEDPTLNEGMKNLDLALFDLNKAITLDISFQNMVSLEIVGIHEKKKKVEAEYAKRLADRYDPKDFIVVPEPGNFHPANYTSADLFDAVAAAEKFVYYQGLSAYPSKLFVSDVVFVYQDGTDIRFRTADNAIAKTMKVSSRTGLTAGQKVRVYYEAFNIKDWEVIAIKRL